MMSALGEMGFQGLHLLVDRIAGLDHDDDRTRRADGGNEFFDRSQGTIWSFSAPALSVEFARRVDRAVENGDPVAFSAMLSARVRAHDSETD